MVMIISLMIHRTENEDVVQAVLKAQPGAPSSRFVLRAPLSLSSWTHRGITSAVVDTNGNGIGDRCIRASYGHDLTNGHFVARFERINGSDALLATATKAAKAAAAAAAATKKGSRHNHDSNNNNGDDTASAPNGSRGTISKPLTEAQVKKATKKAKKDRQRAAKLAAIPSSLPSSTPAAAAVVATTAVSSSSSSRPKAITQKRARSTTAAISTSRISSSKAATSTAATVAATAGVPSAKKRARLQK